MANARYNSTPRTYTDNDFVDIATDDNGRVIISPESGSGSTSATFDHGSNRDVDTTAEALTSTSFATAKGITIVADSTNTGIVYVGNSDVTAGTTAATDGFPLGAGESITLEVSNPNLLYVIGSANNQIVYWVAV